jgi:hypothetical protein
MRVLFDQGTPVPLRSFLTRHSVRTAAEQQWSTLGNGDLLDAAEAAGFDVFVTTDKNIRHQQNLAKRIMAIVVLVRSQWPLLQQHVERVVAAVDTVAPGGCIEVEIPD